MRYWILCIALASGSPVMALPQAVVIPDVAQQHLPPLPGEVPNRDTVYRFFRAVNAGDAKAAAEFYYNDPKVAVGGLRDVLEDIYTTFPDWRMDVEAMVAHEDFVIVVCRVSGTHRGMPKRHTFGSTLIDVPPTHKRFEVQHIYWFRVRDGKLVELYSSQNELRMARQLGLLPAIGLPKPQ